jgi:hypothetical protein
MSELPPEIKAAQEKLRPRFEAQTARMESLAASSFASEIADAEVTHDVSADEALGILAGEAETNQ